MAEKATPTSWSRAVEGHVGVTRKLAMVMLQEVEAKLRPSETMTEML